MLKLRAFGRKRKYSIPEPCIVLGQEVIINADLLKDWHNPIVGSFAQYQELTRYGINITDVINIDHLSRVKKAISLKYDPICLVGTGFTGEASWEKGLAPVAYKSTSTLIDCTGSYTTMLPHASVAHIVGLYKDGPCDLVNEDMPQRERVARWMAAHGFVMVRGQALEFGRDLTYLRMRLTQLEVDDIDSVIKEVVRLDEQSEDASGPLFERE